MFTKVGLASWPIFSWKGNFLLEVWFSPWVICKQFWKSC